MVFFAVAAVAMAAGAVLLSVDSRRRELPAQLRRDWARAHGMRPTPTDPVRAGKWTHGALAEGGPATARDVVVGEYAGVPLLMLDLMREGRVNAIVLALRAPSTVPVLELRLASAARPTSSATDLLGQVGTRYAFTSDLEAARRVLDEQLIAVADAAGADVDVLWAECGWVLAALPVNAERQRWEETAQVLVRFAERLRAPAAGQGWRVQERLSAGDEPTAPVGEQRAPVGEQRAPVGEQPRGADRPAG